MNTIIAWVTVNPDMAVGVVVGVLSLLSGAFEGAGMTRTSKVLGTMSLDLGRIMRKLRGQS
jgi:hypothetical protein